MSNVPRRNRIPGLIAIVALTVAMSPLVVPARARAMQSVPTQRVEGVGSQQPGLAYERPLQLNKDLDAVEAAGMTWVRADFVWSEIQPHGPDSWDWAPTDAFVQAANAHHLQVLGMLAYAPRWARAGSEQHDPPKDPDDYANFAHAAAQRYAPMGVHAWEVWNEPNLAEFWSPAPDPVAYATLLRRTYPAIKSADPQATVVSGGLAPSKDNGAGFSPTSFLVELYFHGAKGNFDALGLHPYSYPYAPMHKAPWNVFYNTPSLHRLMRAVGDGNKQIWGTELGYPTGTSTKAVSDPEQADDLVAAITAWQKWSFTGPLFIFQLRDTTKNPLDTVDNMGILRWNGTPKPAYTAIGRTLR